MKSMPLAIGWEMLRRGRWGLLLAVLGANALPVLLFTALRYDGALEPAEPSGLIMHAVVVQMNVFLFGTAVVASLSPISRLYTYPVSTESLVAWHLLPGMGAVAIEMLLAIGFLNGIFNLGWQPLGPVLFSAATFAALQAALWLAEKSGWLPVIFGVATIPLCLWFKWQYGPFWGDINHYWTVVTLGDAATLAAISIGAYVVGVFGVARNRCGSPPYSTGLIAWLTRVFSLGPETGLALRDPLRAQFWFEWRTKGGVMPAIVGMGLFMGFGIWLLANRSANALFEGLVAGGALLVLAGLLGGFVFGNVGRVDSDIQIGQFLATRPLTNTQLAGTILKTTAKGVFFGWAIWAIAFAIICAVLRALPVTLGVTPPAPLGWWYIPIVLLGAWTAAGVMVALTLTGRQHLVAGFIFVAITLGVGLMVFSKTVLSPQAQDYFARGVAVFCGVIFLLGTIWALVAARRRELITGQTLSLGAVAWAALCVLAVFFWSPTSVDRLSVYILITGILALAIAPLATAPLALAWNRTR